MDSEHDSLFHFFPEDHFDPDFMSRTYPKEWDMSALHAPKGSKRNGKAHKGDKRHSGDKTHESFPKLRTMPDQWDLSELSTSKKD